MKRLISLAVLVSVAYIAVINYPKPSGDKFVGVVAKVMPSVVEIQVSGKMERTDLFGETHVLDVGVLGSGVFVSKKGHILTCAHLFREFKGPIKIRVISQDGSVVSGTVLKVSDNPSLDLAVITAGFYKKTPSVTLCNPMRLAVGQEVFAIGSPLGLSFSVTSGIISALYRDFDGYAYNVTQSDTSINPGNSGGPLFDLHGRLVGINIFHQTDNPFGGFTGLGFSVQSGECIKFLTDCKKLDPKLVFSW
jgi:S1-C subfamily serine protease